MFKPEVYKQRRDALKAKIKSGIALFLGNNEAPMNYAANTYHFRQDSTFLYFFGIDLPGIAGVIDFDEGKDYIFGTDVDIESIIWMGPQPTMKDNAMKVGVELVKPFEELDEFLKNVLSQSRKIHYIPQYRHDNMILLEKLTGIKTGEQKSQSSVDLIRALVDLRSVKDQYEIVELEKAAAIGYEMHVTAMRMAKPGVSEREIFRYHRRHCTGQRFRNFLPDHPFAKWRNPAQSRSQPDTRKRTADAHRCRR